MRRIIATLATISWALWTGGLISLFVFVEALFQFDRSLAVQTAPRLFLTFQKYQLILAACGLVLVVGWCALNGSKLITMIFLFLAIAAIAGVSVSIWIVPPMERLRAAGQSSSAQFHQLHGRSMMLYVGEALMLLAAGAILPLAIQNSSRQIDPEIARPTDFPV